MRVIVGDCAGLLKEVSIEKSAVVRIYGQVDKKREVQRTCWGDAEESTLFVGRKDRTIQQLRTADFGVVNDFSGFTGDFVGLHSTPSHIISGVDSGKVELRPLQEEGTSSDFNAGPNLRCVRINDTHAATGGMENDLKIWDLNTSKMRFKASKIAHDRMGLRVPVCVTDIQFLSDDCTKLVVASEYAKLLLYDTRVGSGFCNTIKHGDFPLRTMELSRDRNQVIVGDTIGSVYRFDLRTLKLSCKFKGFSGTVKSLKMHQQLPYLASASLDRFLRVHHSESKALLKRIYLKQQLTCCLFSSEGLITEKKKDEKRAEEEEEVVEGEENEDDVWDQIKEVGEKGAKAKAKKSSGKRTMPEEDRQPTKRNKKA